MSFKLKKPFVFMVIAAVAVMFCNSCNDPLQPGGNQKPEDVDWGLTSIVDVLKGSAGDSFDLKAAVVGANEQGVILSQNDGAYIYAFKGEAHGLDIGDLVNVSGTLVTRNGLLQFDKGCKLDKIGECEVKFPEAEEYTVEKIEAYMSAPSIKYVTYSYQSMSVRNNQSSKGSFSLYPGSGKNNIFFSTAPNYFIIENIALPQTKLKLFFGAQRYAQGASNDFLKSDFEVRVSADGEVWSQKLDYDFGDVADVPGQWRRASVDFTLPDGTNTLYIKFVAKSSSVNRIDDVMLFPGEGGQVIEFGKEEVVNTSTIAEILASPIDNVYKAEGQVAAISSKSFLLTDATGSMLVFKKNHGVVAGDKVTVEGATAEYGGLKQFGETSVITRTSEGSFTLPEPKALDAAYCEAFVNAPKIEYVSFAGDLTSYRDNIYQMHYNVAIEGTDIQIAVQYPIMAIDKFVGSKVRIDAYAIGVTNSSDTKYLNVMATSIDFAETEEIPAEEQAISVKEFNAKAVSLTAGASLSDMVAVVGYVAANNEGGALYQVISLVDNTGEPNSGIIIKDDDFTEATLPVGTKVIVSLKRAVYDVNKGLPQIRKATVYPTGAKGNTVAAYVTNYAVYKNEKIAHVTADLLGVMEVYNGLYELIPTSMSDVAGFKVEE